MLSPLWGCCRGRLGRGNSTVEDEGRPRRAGLQLRYDLAVQFAAFEAGHAGGIQAHDRDVDDYMEKTE